MNIKELLESRGHKILATKMRNMAAANNQSKPDTQATHTAVAPAADLTKTVKQDAPPFEPDAPKRNPSALPGKSGIGHSVARHLARQGLKTMTKEEVEQIDELSKDTLKSYIGKATKDMGERKRQQQIAVDRSNQPRLAGKYGQRSAMATADVHAAKATSRAKNIGKAAMKFAEEVEVNEQTSTSHLNVNHNKYYSTQDRIRHRKGTLKTAVAENAGITFSGLREKMKDPCWKNYRQLGTKMKNGKEVPNCIPEETNLDESGGEKVFTQGADHIERYADNSFAVYRNGVKQTFYTTLDAAKAALMNEDKSHKNPTGGLTQKGRDAYNRETGGNLQAPVTTPPSKLDPDSKAAKRRKSFCARMGGNKGPMEKDGKPTRKALALRKWNC